MSREQQKMFDRMAAGGAETSLPIKVTCVSKMLHPKH
jgi:hypothetical protein